MNMFLNNKLKNSEAFFIFILFIVLAVNPVVLSDGLIIENELNGIILDVQPGISWVKTLGLPIDNDEIYSVYQTSDDGYIMTGFSRSYSSDHYEDAWLVKTDKYGNEEWSKTFGELGMLNIDEGRSVQQTSDGGYVFFGVTFSFGESEGDAWLVKTDKYGIEQWNKTFGGDNCEHGNSVYQTLDGGYILAGRNTSSPSGRAWLFKTDDKGVEQWSKNFYHGYSASGFFVQQTSDGGYIMAGRVFIDKESGFLVKTDKDGNEQWNKTYGQYSGFKCVQQTLDDGFIACGGIGTDLGLSMAWLVKTDKYGNEQWNKTFNDPPTFAHYAWEVDQTTDGGYILVGQSHYVLLDNSWLIKTDSYGYKEWQFDIEETENHCKILYSGQQTSDGGYIVAGKNGNGLLIKVDLFENQNPSSPTVTGPKRGIPDLPCKYTAVSSDPDGDSLSYFFDWGDNYYTCWTEPFGTSATRSHSWRYSGIYTIKVKAMDEYGAQSDWTSFKITMPRNKVNIGSYWLRFIDMFPILQKILNYILK